MDEIKLETANNDLIIDEDKIKLKLKAIQDSHKKNDENHDAKTKEELVVVEIDHKNSSNGNNENGTTVKNGQNGHSHSLNGKNGHAADLNNSTVNCSSDKIYIEDTDDDNNLNNTSVINETTNLVLNKTNNTSCGDFHLELSQSILNQSSVSINRKSAIANEDEDQDETDVKEHEDKKKNVENGKELEEVKEIKMNGEQEAIVLNDEDEDKDVLKSCSQTESVEEKEKDVFEEKVNGKKSDNNEFKVVEENNKELDDETKVQQVPVELQVENIQANETKPEQAKIVENIEVVEKTEVKNESKVEEPVVPGTSVANEVKTNNDECIIMHDDEDEVCKEEEVTNKQTVLINSEKSKEDVKEVVIDVNTEAKIETTNIDDVKTEEVVAAKGVVRGRKSIKKAEEVAVENEEMNQVENERPKRATRVSLVSSTPVNNIKKETRKSLSVLQKKKSAQELEKDEENVLNENKIDDELTEKDISKVEEIDEIKKEVVTDEKLTEEKPKEEESKEEKKESETEFESTKVEKPVRGRRGLKAKEKEEEVIEEEKKTESTGITRRSSLRVRNPPAAVVNLKEQLKQKKVETQRAKNIKEKEEEKSDGEPVDETTANKRRAADSVQKSEPEAQTNSADVEPPVKRGRGRRATQVIKKEDIPKIDNVEEQVEENRKEDANLEEESEIIEKKTTTLKRRGSLASSLKPKVESKTENEGESKNGKMTRNRRQTVAFSSAANNTVTSRGAKKKKETEETIVESEKEVEEEEEVEEKATKKKRVSISRNKKNKVETSVQEDEETEGELEVSKTTSSKGRKSKNQNSSLNQSTKPKLFFQSKSKSPNEQNKKRYSNILNITPSQTAHVILNKSVSNVTSNNSDKLDSSLTSPNKKFKLHQAKSSSSESEGEDENETSLKRKSKSKSDEEEEEGNNEVKTVETTKTKANSRNKRLSLQPVQNKSKLDSSSLNKSTRTSSRSKK